MSKLTKEQAQMLSEYFASLTEGKIFPVPEQDLDAFTKGWKAAEKALTNMLEGCTEKPFPEFITPFDEGNDYIRVSETPHCIKLSAHNEDTFLEHNEFRQFVEGCNKIVDWLNDQNK